MRRPPLQRHGKGLAGLDTELGDVGGGDDDRAVLAYLNLECRSCGQPTTRHGSDLPKEQPEAVLPIKQV